MYVLPAKGEQVFDFLADPGVFPADQVEGLGGGEGGGDPHQRSVSQLPAYHDLEDDGDAPVLQGEFLQVGYCRTGPDGVEGHFLVYGNLLDHVAGGSSFLHQEEVFPGKVLDAQRFFQ